tara:strand:+ start:233 stop:1015 length:783 start_codon:yes stop_codon:yes gene_type:complete
MKLSLGGGLTSIARSFTNAEAPFNTRSVEFNGTDNFVDTNYQTDATFQTSYSISFWIKPADGRPAAEEYIFSMTNTTAANGSLQITLNTTGTLEHSITAGGLTETERTSGAFSNGAQSNWFHFVFTVDMSAKNVNTIIYADGVAVSKVTVSNATSSALSNFAADQDFHIGCRLKSNTGIDRFFTGLMDEFAVFTTVLDAASVAKIYNSGVPMDLETDDGDYDNSGDLELYYRFEDDLTDTTGTSNGTSTASPTFRSDVPE